MLLSRCGRLLLALSLILVWGSSVQGFPAKTGRYQWVRCSPDSASANCIEEAGPLLDLPLRDSDSPADDSFIIPRVKTHEVFPPEDFSGSGSGSGSGSSSGSGSGSGMGSDFLNELDLGYQPIDRNGILFSSYEKNLLSDNQDMGQDGTEEGFII